MSSSATTTETTEGIEEISGIGTETGGEAGAQEAGEEAVLNDMHTPVSKPRTSTTGTSTTGTSTTGTSTTGTSTTGTSTTGSSDEAGDEADTEAGAEAGEESEYEAGWVETSAQEASADTEATVDASQGSGQEFFGFLVPLLAPLAKAVLPQLVGAAARAGSGALQNLINQRARRLRLRIAGRREAGEEATLGEEAIAQMEAEAAAESLAQLENIIGTDDRQRVMNTTANPYNRVCHLRIIAADGTIFLGTGALIGRRSVVTAGHCVYLHNYGGWARSIEVTPGRNEAQAPYGRITATAFHSVRGWTASQNRNYDYGFIVLPQAPNPFPGSFGVASGNTDAEVRNRRLNTAGYPGDKAQLTPGSMWRHGRRATAVSPTVITYDIDTAGGQSGSAVWIKYGTTRRIVGIHTNGAPSGNSATRINARVRANLVTWQRAAERAAG